MARTTQGTCDRSDSTNSHSKEADLGSLEGGDDPPSWSGRWARFRRPWGGPWRRKLSACTCVVLCAAIIGPVLALIVGTVMPRAWKENRGRNRSRWIIQSASNVLPTEVGLVGYSEHVLVFDSAPNQHLQLVASDQTQATLFQQADRSDGRFLRPKRSWQRILARSAWLRIGEVEWYRPFFRRWFGEHIGGDFEVCSGSCTSIFNWNNYHFQIWGRVWVGLIQTDASRKYEGALNRFRVLCLLIAKCHDGPSQPSDCCGSDCRHERIMFVNPSNGCGEHARE